MSGSSLAAETAAIHARYISSGINIKNDLQMVHKCHLNGWVVPYFFSPMSSRVVPMAFKYESQQTTNNK